jgi:hypothetical protein
MTYCLIACTLAIQFMDTLTKHFSPHQFGVMTLVGVKQWFMMLNLHPNWVVLQVGVCNAFNFVSQLAIF